MQFSDQDIETILLSLDDEDPDTDDFKESFILLLTDPVLCVARIKLLESWESDEGYESPSGFNSSDAVTGFVESLRENDLTLAVFAGDVELKVLKQIACRPALLRRAAFYSAEFDNRQLEFGEIYAVTQTSMVTSDSPPTASALPRLKTPVRSPIPVIAFVAAIGLVALGLTGWLFYSGNRVASREVVAKLVDPETRSVVDANPDSRFDIQIIMPDSGVAFFVLHSAEQWKLLNGRLMLGNNKVGGKSLGDSGYSLGNVVPGKDDEIITLVFDRAADEIPGLIQNVVEKNPIDMNELERQMKQAVSGLCEWVAVERAWPKR